MSIRVVLGMAVAFSVGVVRAGTLHWDGGSVDLPADGNGASAGGAGTWDETVRNWDQGAGLPHVNWTNANNDTAVFGGATGTVTLGGSVSAGGLQFNSAFSLAGAQTLTLNSPATISGSANAILGTNTALVLAGSAGLTKSGTGSLTLNPSASSTFTGGLTVNGGSVTLDLANLAVPTNLVDSSNALTLGGGTLVLRGRGSTATAQSFGSLTVNSGGSVITLVQNAATSLTAGLGVLTRSTGGTLGFSVIPNTNTVIATTSNSNEVGGILGPWLAVGATTNLQYGTVNGSSQIVGFAGATATAQPTNLSDVADAAVNYSFGATNAPVLTGNITANTLRFAGTTAVTVSNGGFNMTLNGLMNAGANALTIAGAGNVVIGTNRELVIIANGQGATINSQIADDAGGASTLVYSGAGSTLRLGNGTNTYSGGTVVNSGTLTMTTIGGSTNDRPLGTGSVIMNSGSILATDRQYIQNALTLNSATVTAGNSFGSTLTGPITLTGMPTFNITGGFSLPANMSGPGGLTKIGTSFVPVTGTNTYAGPTLITGGTLGFRFPASLYNGNVSSWTSTMITVGSGAGLVVYVGGTGEFAVGQAGALFNALTMVESNGLRGGSAFGFNTGNAGGATQSIALAFNDSSGPGGGSVGIVHFGPGTLELAGSNTFSGIVGTENNGTLRASSLNSISNNPLLGTVHAASSSLGAPTNAAGGTIWLGRHPLSGNFSGGNLTYTGPGETTDRTLNLGGANSSTYTLDQSGGGLLKFLAPFTITDNRGPKTIQLQGSTSGTGEIAGAIPVGQSTNQPNHVTKAGSGTWVLSAANNNSGGVFTVTGGALVLGNATAVPGGIGVAGGVSAMTLSGGVFGLGAGDFTRNLAAAGAVTGVNFTGNGGWAAYGADRAVNLGGTSAPVVWASATTGLNAKVLILGNATATHTLDFQNPLELGAAARTVQVDDGAAATDARLSGGLTGSIGGNLIKTGSGTLELAGINTYAGATVVSTGTLLLADGALTGTSGITNNARLVFSPSGSVTVPYPVRGTGSIAKTGSGVLILSGASTYAGPFVVSNGTLLMNGLSGTGLLTVASGGTLGGTGTIRGIVNASGTVEPGESVGQLTISNDYNQTGALDVELGSGSNDLLFVTGAAQLGGTLNVTLVGGYMPQTNDTFVLLLANAGITGNFAVTNLVSPGAGKAWDLQNDGNALTLTVVPASGPPPATGYNAFSNLHVLVQGPEGDDDGDGLANLYEYVTGTSPTNAGAGINLGATRPAGVFSVRFPRDTNTVDATLIVEGAYATTNDTTWTGIATNLNGSWGSSTNVTELGGPTVVEVTVPDSAPPATNRFLRLRVTRP